MQKVQGLDEDLVSAMPMTLKDLKKGKKYEATIISSSWEQNEAINLKLSNPVHLQVSPFVRGNVAFNQIVSLENLAKFGS